MASLIGRGKNVDFPTIKQFLYAIPKEDMAKNEFDSFAELRMSGFIRTHSQVARQLGLYYCDNNQICHPRFKRELTAEEIIKYANHWAKKYIVPNPYTEDYPEDSKPIIIYSLLASCHKVPSNTQKLNDLINKLLGFKVNNVDKIRAVLINLTSAYINTNDEIEFPDSEINPLEVDINSYDVKAYYDYYSDSAIDVLNKQYKLVKNTSNEPLQQIFYGAPGTGKSYKVKEITEQYKDTIRTTFHPDSDYSTFVGAYKPIKETRDRYGLNQKETVRLKGEDGKPLKEEVITYNFVPQVFIKVYLNAWKLMDEANKSGEEPKPIYLVIEEINRGNCAQIFGDLFQLLDRGRDGFSSYAIVPDSDIQKFLKEDNELGFGKGLTVSDVLDDTGQIIATSEEIRNGEKFVLPCNLHIWATMNTSDQSLFPIDSAFKRRWAWKYVKIKDAKKNWKIEANSTPYDWYEFIQSINEVINNMTSSADKQLGYFFCKASKKANETDAEPTIITAETFVGKVLFYLWNDVFKEYGFDNSELFKYTKNDEGTSVEADLTFPDFYNDDNEVNVDIVSQFIKNVLSWKSDNNK